MFVNFFLELRQARIPEPARVPDAAGGDGEGPRRRSAFGRQSFGKALDLQCLDSKLRVMSVGEERTKNVKKQSELKDWILQQYNVLDEKFSPFLKLQH